MEINHSKPPTFKVKIPYYNDKIQNLVVYDKNNNKIDYTIEKLEKLKVILLLNVLLILQFILLI